MQALGDIWPSWYQSTYQSDLQFQELLISADFHDNDLHPIIARDLSDDNLFDPSVFIWHDNLVESDSDESDSDEIFDPRVFIWNDNLLDTVTEESAEELGSNDDEGSEVSAEEIGSTDDEGSVIVRHDVTMDTPDFLLHEPVTLWNDAAFEPFEDALSVPYDDVATASLDQAPVPHIHVRPDPGDQLEEDIQLMYHYLRLLIGVLYAILRAYFRRYFQ